MGLMTVELRDLTCFLALTAEVLPDAARGAIDLMYSAGASGGLDPGPLAAGGAAGGAAGAGAAAGAGSGTTGSGTADGTTGGSDVGRNDATRPSVPTSVQARRDAQREYDQSTLGRLDRGLLNASETVQKWAESIVGVEVKGTAPAGSQA